MLTHDDTNHCPKNDLLHLAFSLQELRDGLMDLSLSLKDLMADMPSPEREQVLQSVKDYLGDLKERG
jgi:hypothetical protein